MPATRSLRSHLQPSPKPGSLRHALSADMLELEQQLDQAEGPSAERLYERVLRMRRVIAKIDNHAALRQGIRQSG